LIMENIKVIVRRVKKEGNYLKMKFSSVWDIMHERVTIPDVHIEWREIGESILLVSFSMTLYVSVVLTQFTFVPIMIITIKRGWKEASVYLALALVFLLYIMANAAYRIPLDSGLLLFSPTHFTFDYIGSLIGIKLLRFLDFFFVYGLLGVFIGSLVSMNYKLKYVMFFSICFYVGIVLFVLSLSGFFGGFETWLSNYSLAVEKKTNSFINLYLSQMDNYQSVLHLRGVDYGFLEEKLAIAAEMYKRSVIFGIAPRGGYLIKQIIIIFLSILFVKLYFKRKLHKAALYFDIKRYRVADDWVWALLSAWGLVYINLYLRNNILGIISWNSAVIISFFFFLKGLSILRIVADRLKIPVFLQYGGMLFLLVYFFILFVTIVSGIGVADIWLKISEKLNDSEKRRDA
jgi:hypothetical protein